MQPVESSITKTAMAHDCEDGLPPLDGVLRHFFIKSADFRGVASELFESDETRLQFEWTHQGQEVGFDYDYYMEDFSLWLDRVYLVGVSSTGIGYRRLLWRNFTIDLYMELFFSSPGR